ncbi:MAG: hypothetical protein AB1831_02305 [Pseudomonadota bacterium]
MSTWRRPVLLFFLLLALFPAIASVARLFQGETPGPLGWLGVAAFPFLAWLWWRHFSRFGAAAACHGGCLPAVKDPVGGSDSA